MYRDICKIFHKYHGNFQNRQAKILSSWSSSSDIYPTFQTFIKRHRHLSDLSHYASLSWCSSLFYPLPPTLEYETAWWKHKFSIKNSLNKKSVLINNLRFCWFTWTGMFLLKSLSNDSFKKVIIPWYSIEFRQKIFLSEKRYSFEFRQTKVTLFPHLCTSKSSRQTGRLKER